MTWRPSSMIASIEKGAELAIDRNPTRGFAIAPGLW